MRPPKKKMQPMAVKLARKSRKRQTPSEEKAWEIVRDRRCFGLKFQRQRPMSRFRVDFYCAALDLILEIDGGIHDDAEHAAQDRERSLLLQKKYNLRVMRLRNEDVSQANIEQLLRPLLPHPPSAPSRKLASPKRRGGVVRFAHGSEKPSRHSDGERVGRSPG
jgi:very-short-patch-repair endonuclease